MSLLLLNLEGAFCGSQSGVKHFSNVKSLGVKYVIKFRYTTSSLLRTKTAWKKWSREILGARSRISRGHFFSRFSSLICVTHDGLNERGTTRRLDTPHPHFEIKGQSQNPSDFKLSSPAAPLPPRILYLDNTGNSYKKDIFFLPFIYKPSVAEFYSKTRFTGILALS